MKLGLIAVPLILMGVTQAGVAATQGNFKRFSVSAGWLACDAARKSQSI